MPNDDYIDNRSFNELVAATTHDEKYDFIVENILRDKQNGWRLNYYKSEGTSSCDAEICRMNGEIISRTNNIANNEKLLTSIDTNIKEAGSKKVKKPQLEAWDKQYVLAEEDIAYDKARIQELKSLLLKWQWNRYLELSTENAIQRCRNRFMRDFDKESLKKGITMACSYNEKNRYKLIDDDYYPYDARDNSDF